MTSHFFSAIALRNPGSITDCYYFALIYYKGSPPLQLVFVILHDSKSAKGMTTSSLIHQLKLGCRKAVSKIYFHLHSSLYDASVLVNCG
jgi:hypothetical protein